MSSGAPARRREDWQQLISEHKQSGLTVKAFCQKQGVSEASFYSWRKRIVGGGQPAGFALVAANGVAAGAGALPPSRLMGSFAIHARGVQRRFSVARKGLRVEQLRGLRRRFCRPDETSAGWAHRPCGLAVCPDGAFYVSDDIPARIYRIVYKGGVASSASSTTPCPSRSAPLREPVQASAQLPEGTHTKAGAAATAKLPVRQRSDAVNGFLGDRIYLAK